MAARRLSKAGRSMTGVRQAICHAAHGVVCSATTAGSWLPGSRFALSQHAGETGLRGRRARRASGRKSASCLVSGGGARRPATWCKCRRSRLTRCIPLLREGLLRHRGLLGLPASTWRPSLEGTGCASTALRGHRLGWKPFGEPGVLGRRRLASCRQPSCTRCACGARGQRCKAQREPAWASCLRISSRVLLRWPSAGA